MNRMFLTFDQSDFQVRDFPPLDALAQRPGNRALDLVLILERDIVHPQLGRILHTTARRQRLDQ